MPRTASVVSNGLPDYEPYFMKWSDEELANCADEVLLLFFKHGGHHLVNHAAERDENGGIRERMTAVRLGRRQTQNEEIAALKAKVARLGARERGIEGEA